MKKIIAIVASLAIALALAACAANTQNDAPEQEAAQGEPTANMANPWSEADSPEAAAEGAGVGSFTLPDDGMVIDGGPVNWDAYRYMDLLAQADGFVGAAELTVRKGVNRPDHEVKYDTADVSGDYEEYKHKWTIEAADWQVQCYGNEDGRTMKAIWHSDNFSYSIVVRGQGDIAETYGLGNDDIAALVGAIA